MIDRAGGIIQKHMLKALGLISNTATQNRKYDRQMIGR